MALGGYAYGGVAWGSQVAFLPATVIQGLDVVITIQGVEYTGKLLLNTLSIRDEINNRNACSLSIIDEDQLIHFQVGQVVRVTYRGALIFAGTIDDISEETAGLFSTATQHNLTCIDFNQYCDRHVIAQKYAVADQLLKDIVNKIVTIDSGDANERISNEGVTYDFANTQPGPALSIIVFNYQTVAECFDDLSELVGYFWNVDYNKKLIFVDRSTFIAPQPLDENRWQQFRNVRVTRGRQDYRNVQFLRGGDDETIIDNEIEQFKGDGKNESFVLKFRVARTPTIAVDTGGGFVAKTVGIKDVDTGKDWYYEVGEDKITQDKDGTTLTSTHTLQVTYTGLFKIIMQGRSENEISGRKNVEGGTGIYVNVELDEKINDAGLATEKINALLRRLGRIANVVEFETDVDGFQSGQLLSVNLPEHSLTGQYLIESVNFDMVDDSFFRYRIRAIDGESQGSWVDFFKRLSTKGRPFVIRENEKLSLLRQMADVITLSDSMSTVQPLQTWTNDYSSIYILGLSKIGARKTIFGTATESTYFGPLVGNPTNFT